MTWGGKTKHSSKLLDELGFPEELIKGANSSSQRSKVLNALAKLDNANINSKLKQKFIDKLKTNPEFGKTEFKSDKPNWDKLDYHLKQQNRPTKGKAPKSKTLNHEERVEAISELNGVEKTFVNRWLNKREVQNLNDKELKLLDYILNADGVRKDYFNALNKVGCKADDFEEIVNKVLKEKSLDKQKIQHEFRVRLREKVATKLSGTEKGLRELRELTDEMLDTNSRGRFFESWANKYINSGGSSKEVFLNGEKYVPDNVITKGKELNFAEYKNLKGQDVLDTRDKSKIIAYADYISQQKKIQMDGEKTLINVDYIFSTKKAYENNAELIELWSKGFVNPKYVSFENGSLILKK